MQAVYSTSTEVKIHQAIRREWRDFQAWMFEQLRLLESREREILYAAQRRWGKMKAPDKEQISGLQKEFLAGARAEWLARVRKHQLHLEHWVMTPDEKHALDQTLSWTHKEMVDAYAKEQEKLGPLYQRVDPVSLGTQEPLPGKFTHPKSPEQRPAYENWAAELGFTHPKSPKAKLAYENWAAESAKLYGKSPRKPRSQSVLSAELPSMPLYFVGALLQGTDLDAVAASHLENFAAAKSEEKIREYYAQALDASLRFQRRLPTLDASAREIAQDEFDAWMGDLKSKKEHEWRDITIKELRKQQALEQKRRAAQQRAIRPRAAPPKRKMRRRDQWDYNDDGWNVINSPQTQSSQRTAQREGFEEYQSPPESSWDYMEEFPSPLPPRRARPKRQKRRSPASVEEYAVSPPADDRRLRRRNAVHREDPEPEGYSEPWPDATPYEPLPEWPLPRRRPPPPPQETGLLSALTNWLGSCMRPWKRRRAPTVSSFDWMEPSQPPYSENDGQAKARSGQKDQEQWGESWGEQGQSWGSWGEDPGAGSWGEDRDAGTGYHSEEEFPMRKRTWGEKLSWKGLRNRITRKPSVTASDIGWATPENSEY